MAFWSHWSPCLSVNNVNMQHRNDVVQYKTACSWSLLLLHNTVGGVLWTDEYASGMPYIVLVIDEKSALNTQQLQHRLQEYDLPKWWMRAEEMMTPTLPRVSASMWRKIPGGREGERERERGKERE